MSESTSKASERVEDFALTVHGDEFKFRARQEHFDRFVREMDKDMGKAARNFLLRTCAANTDKLRDLFDEHWGLAITMMGPVVEELLPDVRVRLKKL